MFTKKVLDILSKVEVFDGLTRDDLKVVSKYCRKTGFQQGDILLEMGSRPDALYVLIKGQLKVFLPEQIKGRKERRGSEVKLNILKAGDCFGEYSIIDKAPASASIAATQAGELLKIPEEEFNLIMVNDVIGKRVYYNMLQILIKRLREKEKGLDLVLIAG